MSRELIALENGEDNNFSVTIEGERYIVDVEGKDEMSKIILGAVRECRKDLKDIEKNIYFGREGHLRGKKSRGTLRKHFQPEIDKKLGELRILNGSENGEIRVIKSDDKIIGIKIEEKCGGVT